MRIDRDKLKAWAGRAGLAIAAGFGVLKGAVDVTGINAKEAVLFLRECHLPRWLADLVFRPLPAINAAILAALAAGFGSLYWRERGRRFEAERKFAATTEELAGEATEETTPATQPEKRKVRSPSLRQFTEMGERLVFEQVVCGMWTPEILVRWAWDGDDVKDLTIVCPCGKELEIVPPMPGRTSHHHPKSLFSCGRCGFLVRFDEYPPDLFAYFRRKILVCANDGTWKQAFEQSRTRKS